MQGICNMKDICNMKHMCNMKDIRIMLHEMPYVICSMTSYVIGCDSCRVS